MRHEGLDYDSPFEVVAQSRREARDFELRADLMLAIRDLVEHKGMSQRDVMDALGTSQPRVSDLLNGKFRKFSVDLLLSYLRKLGYELTIDYQPGDMKIFLEAKSIKKPLETPREAEPLEDFDVLPA